MVWGQQQAPETFQKRRRSRPDLKVTGQSSGVREVSRNQCWSEAAAGDVESQGCRPHVGRARGTKLGSHRCTDPAGQKTCLMLRNRTDTRVAPRHADAAGSDQHHQDGKRMPWCLILDDKVLQGSKFHRRCIRQ